MDSNNGIFFLLSNIFYTSKNNNKILVPILKNTEGIKNLIIFFENKEKDINIKYNIIVELYTLFKSNISLISVFMRHCKKNNINFLYKLIFDIYLDEKIDRNKEEFIEKFIILLLANYSLPKSAPEYIYQNLSKFFDKNNCKIELTNKYFMKCLNLLHICLCRKNHNDKDNIIIDEDKINNYIYFNGINSCMYLKINKNSVYGIDEFPNLDNGCSFVFWIYLDKNLLNYYANINIYNLIINLISIKISSYEINLNMINGKYFIIGINKVESEPIDITKNFNFGKWVNICFIINKKILMNQQRFKILIDGSEMPIHMTIPKNIPWKNNIESISLFKNFIGKVSSLMFFTFPISQKLINYLNNEMKGGIYKNKILVKFLLHNDINYFKNAVNYKYSKKYKSKKNEKLINILLKEKNAKNLISIFSPFAFNNKDNTIDDVFGNFIAVLYKNDGVNNKNNHFKNIEIIGGINNLLPISELMLKYKNSKSNKRIISEELLLKYLLIIKDIILAHNNNLINANKNYFFSNLRLFFECYPSIFFTQKILDLLLDIGKTIFQNNDIKNIQNDDFMNNFLLNEKIFGKFSFENQIKMWEEIYKYFTSDYLKMKESFNINKICIIIRFYDRKRYTEYCCKKHSDLIMLNSKNQKDVMKPEMNEKTHKLFDNVQLYINKFWDKDETTNLFKLLNLDLSPCIQNKIIQVYINFFNDKNISEKAKEFTFDNLIKSNFFHTTEYLFSISLSDVHLSILKLYQILFQSYPNKILTCLSKEISPFFDFIGKQLLLNHISIEVNNIKKSEDDTMFDSRNNENKFFEEHNKLKRSNSSNIKKQNKKYSKYFQDFNVINKEKISIMKLINKEIYNNDKQEIFTHILSWIYSSHNYNKKKPTYIFTNYLLNLILNIISKEDITLIEHLLIALNPIFQDKETIKYSEIYHNKNLLIWLIKYIYIFNTKENLKAMEKIDDKIIDNIKTRLFDILKLFLQYNNEDKKDYEKCLQFIYEYAIYTKNIVDQEKIKEMDKKKKKNEIIRITSLILLKCCEFASNNFNITSRICFNYLLNYNNSNFILTYKKVNTKPPPLSIKGTKTMKKNYKFKSPDIITEYNKTKKDKYININNFNKNKDAFIPNYILKDINYTSFYKEDLNSLVDNTPNINFSQTNNNSKIKKTKSFLLKEIWRDFQIYDYIIDYYYSNLWSLENLCKIVKIEYDNNINILMKKLFKEYTNKKNKNILFNYIIEAFGFNTIKKDKDTNIKINIFQSIKKKETLTNKINININKETSNNNNNINNNNSKNSFYQNINILTMNLILLSIANEIISDKVQKEYLENQYQQFIIFCIILSINIKTKEKKYGQIQNELYNIIGYACIFLKAKKDSKYQQIIKYLIIPILKASNTNYPGLNTKQKGFKKMLALPKKTLYKDTAIYKLFRKNKNNNQDNNLKGVGLFYDEDEYINRCNSVGNLMNKLNLYDELEWDNETEDENTRDNTGNIDVFINDFEEIDIKNHEITAEILVNKNRVIDAIFGKIGKQYKNINKKIKENIENFFMQEYLKNEGDNNISKYKKIILRDIKILIPSFMENLNMNSNNSFIDEKIRRNRYKKCKRKLFSWLGSWSNRYIFFNHPEYLKQKVKNHYTKEMIKPLLTPVFDINYYLPDFKLFKKENLFNKNNYNYIINLDIDSILDEDEEKNELYNNTNKENNYLEYIYKLNDKEIWKLYNKYNSSSKDKNILHNKSNYIFSLNSPDMFSVCLVKIMNHINGYIYIKDDYLKFCYNENKVDMEDISYDKELGRCYGSIFKGQKSDREKINLIIKYKDIKYIFFRNYYYRETALELFTENNKSYFLNFETNEELSRFLSYIIKTEDDKNNINNIKFRKIITNINDDKEKKKIIGFEKISNNMKSKSNNTSSKVEEWQNYTISTLEFLMWLNIYSGRSFHDLNQYPVFPWIITNYNTNKLNPEKDLRNLNLPIGMLGLNEQGIKRKNTFIEFYENLKNEFEDNYPDFEYQNYLNKGLEYISLYKKKMKKISLKDKNSEINMDNIDISYNQYPYNYGSHYSNSTYVSHFLSRIFPYSFISIEIQGNKFDDPERMFYSIDKTFTSVSTLKDDVRELIPEFYFIPEIFKNINNINLSQDKFDSNGNYLIINDVEMPSWTDNNNINFVIKKRKILENNTLYINKWIDLIFGSKQRGENSEIANNIYMFHTYEKMIKIKEIKKDDQKYALLRLFEMGMTPKLLFKNDIKEKINKNNIFNKGANSGLKYLDESQSLDKNILKIKKFSKMEKNDRIKIIKIENIKNEKLMIYTNNSKYFKMKTKIEKNKKEKVIEKALKIKEKDDIKNIENNSSLYSINYQMSSLKKIPIIIYNDNKLMLKAGFWDGRIEINSISIDSKEKSKSSVIFPGNIYQPIVCMKMTSDEKILICGCSDGTLIIMDVKDDCLLVNNFINNHTEEITSIEINDNLNMFSTSSKDGYIMLYILPSCQLVRAINISLSINKLFGNQISDNFYEFNGDFNFIYADNIFLSSSPLPSIVIYISSKKMFVSYTINGGLISTIQETDNTEKIICSKIFKNINFEEFLIYGTNDGFVKIRSFPKMELVNSIKIYDNCSVKVLELSTDKKCCYTWGQGDEIVIIVDNIISDFQKIDSFK